MALERGLLAKQIQGVHAMLAMALKQPLLAISAEESTMLANGVIDVGEQYAVKINPKVLAWVNLGGAVCTVYAPKLVVLALTRKSRPAAAGARPSQQPPAANSGEAGSLPDAAPPGKIQWG